MLVSPNRDRTAERRAATRLEIIDAAWAIAAEQGLAQVTLRDVAARIGMRAPSLYGHFASKNAIYDAMYQQAWVHCGGVMTATIAELPPSPRAGLTSIARAFFDFSVADLGRHQLMNQRTIPGFEPSADAYAPAVDILTRVMATLSDLGVRDQGDVDLYLAIVGGLIDAQLANDFGGDRWSRLLDGAMEMLADHIGLPPETRSEK